MKQVNKVKQLVNSGQDNIELLKKKMQNLDMEFNSPQISKEIVEPFPVADYYQQNIRPKISNTMSGNGVIGLAGRFLEASYPFKNLTGGNPEEYQLRKGIAEKQNSNKPLEENEIAYMKQLDDEFLLGSAQMTGSMSASKFKLSNKDLKELVQHYRYISDALVGGNYEGARKLTKALPTNQAKEMLSQINELDSNYVAKKVRHLRNAIGNRYAGSESITSLANVKN